MEQVLQIVMFNVTRLKHKLKTHLLWIKLDVARIHGLHEPETKVAVYTADAIEAVPLIVVLR